MSIGDEAMAGRLRSFSDGVFSIVLTLLVLSLALPAGKLRTDGEIVAVLRPLLPKFAGYGLSFILVGVFWMLHAGIDREIRGADRPVLAANLASLFPITVLPFTTDLLTRSLLAPLGWAFYAGDVALAALGMVLLWVVVVRRGFAGDAASSTAYRLIPWRSAILAGAFALSIPAVFADPVLGRYVPLAAPIAFGVLRRRIPAGHGAVAPPNV